MKILVVGQDFPWPQRYGTNFRLGHTVKVASWLGETDFFSFAWRGLTSPFKVPGGIHLNRTEVVQNPPHSLSASQRLKWLISRDKPLETMYSNWTEFSRDFLRWTDPPYDLCWFNKATTFENLGRPRLGPTVVDLDDLEDQKILARLELMKRQTDARGSLKKAGAITQARLNAKRWASLQRSISGQVERVALCSELDLRRFDAPNAVLIPNGYDEPLSPLGRESVGNPPTILLQGSMRYAPNTDAALWLAEEIAPLIRAEIPATEVRLVGEPDGSIVGLGALAQTTVVGQVPQMEPELARADLVAVPIRFGSGTRIKILEAWAHRIPVVSTTFGAEGLHADPDVHYAAGDDAESFAKACCNVIRNEELRRNLVEAGRRLYQERFQWSSIDEKLKSLMLETAQQNS
jgi:polysaccharide biosynthesis protein PslH